MASSRRNYRESRMFEENWQSWSLRQLSRQSNFKKCRYWLIRSRGIWELSKLPYRLSRTRWSIKVFIELRRPPYLCKIRRTTHFQRLFDMIRPFGRINCRRIRKLTAWIIKQRQRKGLTSGEIRKSFFTGTKYLCLSYLMLAFIITAVFHHAVRIVRSKLMIKSRVKVNQMRHICSTNASLSSIHQGHLVRTRRRYYRRQMSLK